MSLIKRFETSLLLILLLVSLLFKTGLEGVKARSVSDEESNLYIKSSLGLMPNAYGSIEGEKVATMLTNGLNSGLLNPYLVRKMLSWPEAVAVTDWSGDGLNDAAVTTSFNWDPVNDNKLQLFEQKLAGELIMEQSHPVDDLSTSITQADLNGDGWEDLAVISQESDTLQIFQRLPDGGVIHSDDYGTGQSPDGIVSGDFNGDMRKDIAVSHAITQEVWVFLQKTDGTLADPFALGVSSAGFNELEKGDLNGDGYDDLVMLRGAGHTSSQVAIFYQINRTLSAPIFRTVEDGGYLAHGLAVGDVTSDGLDDIVVTAGGNMPKAFVNVLPQIPDGTIAEIGDVYPAFHLPEAVEIGDLNHDGRSDVVVVHASWMSVSVYLQGSDNRLTAYESYALPYRDYYRPDSLALGDVNNDGALDVLVANHSSLVDENGLAILYNTGQAPTSAITQPSSGTYTNITGAYTVRGTASEGATSLQISTDGGRTWQSLQDPSNWIFFWTTPSTDGIFTLLTRALDSVGKVQYPPARVQVIVDRTQPEGTLTINDGATYINTPSVTLGVAGSDFYGLAAMRFANPPAGFLAPIPFDSTATWTLDGEDGEKTVQAELTDLAGNTSALIEDTIILDTTPPSCRVLINHDDPYTNSHQVTLTLESNDTNGVTQFRARNSDDEWTAWQPQSPDVLWSLQGSDGVLSLEAQFMDIAGNISSACGDAIVLDTSAPVCTLEINNGAVYTNQNEVTLAISGQDENSLAEMHFRQGDGPWSDWSAYDNSASWILLGDDGSKEISAQITDRAGNPSVACQASITLDSTPPAGFVIINDGNAYTSSENVTLTIGASDLNGVSEIDLSNNGTEWGGWRPYTTPVSWNLLPENGLQTVYVRFRDSVGNVSETVFDEIILDSTPPSGSVIINNGDAFSTQTEVTLNITATDQIPVVDMRFHTDETEWTEWEPFATERAWILSGVDGPKTVYVTFRDMLGNEADPVADTIILDTTGPQCSLFISVGAEFAYTPSVTLNTACSDVNGPVQVSYSNDGIQWSDWETYQAIKPWVLEGEDGLKTVYLKARDVPGNESSIYQDQILLDTAGPSCSFLIYGGAEYVNTTSVGLTIDCQDVNGLEEIRVSNDGNNWSGWSPYSTDLLWTLLAGDGTKTVYLQAKDLVGNQGAVAVQTVILDTQAPAGSCQLVGTDGYVNQVEVQITHSVTDQYEVSELQVRNADTPWSPWAEYAGVSNWTLPEGDGEKQVECRYRDFAGNISTTSVTSAILDQTPPSCYVAINNGVSFVNNELVTIEIIASDDYELYQMRFHNEQEAWTDWETHATSKSWMLTSGEGSKTVSTEVQDRAGNDQECSVTVGLDQSAPYGSLLIAGGNEFTSSALTQLTLDVQDNSSGVEQVCIVNGAGPCNNWLNYQTTVDWNLNLQNEGGTQQVCAWFRDRANNISEPACDLITLDLTAPSGKIVIDEDAPFTIFPTVTLTVQVSDLVSGVCGVQYRNQGGDWGTMQSYQPLVSWNLPSALGVKTVEARFVDCAGNESLLTDSIELRMGVFLPLLFRP